MPTVSTNAELMTALSTAVGGDRIELVAGDYGSLNISGVTFSSDVTLVSADPANPAIVHGLDVRNTSRLVFDSILFDPTNPDSIGPFYVADSAYITIRNSVFAGDEAPSPSGEGSYGTNYGLLILRVDNFVIENNEFFNFSNGIVCYNSTNITVRANDIHTLSADGMDFISVDGVLIEGNWIHDFKVDSTAATHQDMIQFWTSSGEMASRNITIRGNFLDAGTGDLSQSIFLTNALADPYLNLLIENNVIFNDHLHGITVGFTDGLIIRNNTLVDNPSVISPLGWAPQINVSESSLNVTIEDNITADVWNWDVTASHSGWTVGNNLLLEYDPASPDYYVPLFVNVLAVGATLADLRAVVGGEIELGGYGAAMTRADIPMVVGPHATAPSPDPVPEPGVCETLLAEALAVVADLETQLAVSQAALADMTALWGDVVAAKAVVEFERDAALAERDAALLAQAEAETQVAIELDKLAAIVVIAAP